MLFDALSHRESHRGKLHYKDKKMVLSSVTQSPRFEEQNLFIVLVRGIESSCPIHYRLKQPFKRRAHSEEVTTVGESKA